MSLRIIQITDSRGRSGGALQAVLLSRALAGAGHQVLFCAPEAGAAFLWAQEAGLQVCPFTFGSLVGQWKASRRLRQLTREFRADVIHTHHTKAHNVGLLATFGGGMPPLVANRGVLFRPRFPTKYRSQRTAAVIANSRRVKQVLMDSRVSGDKIAVVHNAKEVSDPQQWKDQLSALRESLELSAAGPVVGTVGSARREKGFQHLVEAAPLVLSKLPEATFVLVGSGTERFEPRLEQLGVRDRFVLTGHRCDAAQVMGLFDLFVIPSVDMESCPNVLLEAMSAGLPAVGSDVGGIPEVIVEGETGHVVRPGSSEALAEGILKALGDPSAMRRMGAAGRQRVIDCFRMDLKLERTLAVYDWVLGT